MNESEPPKNGLNIGNRSNASSIATRKKSSIKASDRLFFALVVVSISALLFEIFLHEHEAFQQQGQKVNIDDLLPGKDGFKEMNPALEQLIKARQKEMKNKSEKKDVHEPKPEANKNPSLKGDDEPSPVNMLKILEHAGAKIDEELKTMLPPDENVEALYGRGVRIEGLERCEEFRNTIPADEAEIGGAGMFNTVSKIPM